jgi:hypothetical protein
MEASQWCVNQCWTLGWCSSAVPRCVALGWTLGLLWLVEVMDPWLVEDSLTWTLTQLALRSLGPSLVVALLDPWHRYSIVGPSAGVRWLDSWPENIAWPDPWESSTQRDL